MTSRTIEKPVPTGAWDPHPGARSVIALVCAAMFLDATFYALIAPLLPHYSDQLSLGHLEIALLFAAQPAGAAALAIPAAGLVKSRGPALTMTLGLVTLGCAAIVFAVADSLVVLTACRFVQGASAAFVWCAGLARLQSAIAPDRRGAALGLAGSAAGAGSLGGPAFAALSTVLTIKWTLIGLGAITFALAFALFSLGELPREGEIGRSAVDAGAAGGPSIFSAELFWPAFVIATSGVVLGAVSTIAPLRLADLGAGTVLIAAAFILSAAGEILVAPTVGHFSDRVGRILPIRIALAAAAPLLVAVGLAGTVWLTAPAMALTACVVASLWPLGTALLSDRATRFGRSAADIFALSVVAWSVGLGGGSLLSGALAGALGNGAGLALLALPCLFALAVLRPGATAEDTRPFPRLDPETASPSL